MNFQLNRVKGILSATIFMGVFCSFSCLPPQHPSGALPTLHGLSQLCRMATLSCKAKCHESQDKCSPSDIQRDPSCPKAFQGDGSTVPEQAGVPRHGQETWPYKGG